MEKIDTIITDAGISEEASEALAHTKANVVVV